jgi:hypothetical protein
MKRLTWAAAVAGAVLALGTAAPASAQGALAGAQSAVQSGGSMIDQVQYRPGRGVTSYGAGRAYGRPYYGRPGRVYGRPYYGGGRYYGRRYDNGAGVAAGVIGGLAAGAIIGGALSQAQPAPVQGYAIGSPAWYQYCSQRYRSFDPDSGTFVGYDGVRRPCT